jgi:hypothetical protein
MFFVFAGAEADGCGEQGEDGSEGKFIFFHRAKSSVPGQKFV